MASATTQSSTTPMLQVGPDFPASPMLLSTRWAPHMRLPQLHCKATSEFPRSLPWHFQLRVGTRDSGAKITQPL